MKIQIFFFAILWIVLSAKKRNKLLIVSLDGFRADYLQKIPNLPNLRKLMYNGASPTFVKSSFLTKTFPTHLSIVTGLYEESHGIISNHMWDRKTGKYFYLGIDFFNDKFWFQSIYPIWITAEDNNIRTGIYFWPGSEVAYDNKRPTHYRIYKKNANFTNIISTVLNWLNNEDIGFVLMYSPEPDFTSHAYGPYANKTIKMVENVDKMVGYFMNILKSTPLKDNTNVIFLSDHGMSEPKIFINITFPNDITELVEKVTDLTPVLGIFAKVNCSIILYMKLLEYFSYNRSIKVFLKENVPEFFHYSKNERIPDIIVIANENVSFSGININMGYIPKRSQGIHGYSNEYSSMNSFLVAQGPDIRKSMGDQSNSFNQVDIYHLMCALLRIHPRPNNGTLKAVKSLLTEEIIYDYLNILNSGVDSGPTSFTAISGIILLTLSYFYLY